VQVFQPTTTFKDPFGGDKFIVVCDALQPDGTLLSFDDPFGAEGAKIQYTLNGVLQSDDPTLDDTPLSTEKAPRSKKKFWRKLLRVSIPQARTVDRVDLVPAFGFPDADDPRNGNYSSAHRRKPRSRTTDRVDLDMVPISGVSDADDPRNPTVKNPPRRRWSTPKSRCTS
jgi:hypothetical protein